MIDPVIANIGPLQIRYYGLVYAFGFLAVYLFLRYKKEDIKLKPEEIDSLMIYMVAGMMIGARTLHFIVNDPAIFFKDPLEFFRIWHGGMAFFGALLGAVGGSWLFLKNKKTDILIIFDMVVIPVSFALTLGRIANFLNGELVGTVTSVPWCVNFAGHLGCRHPYQLYAAFSHLLLFGITYTVLKWQYREKLGNGIVFASFLIGYGYLRFLTDFWRENPRFLDLTGWQYLSLITAISGAYMFYIIKKKGRKEKVTKTRT